MLKTDSSNNITSFNKEHLAEDKIKWQRAKFNVSLLYDKW